MLLKDDFAVVSVKFFRKISILKSHLTLGIRPSARIIGAGELLHRSHDVIIHKMSGQGSWHVCFELRITNSCHEIFFVRVLANGVGVEAFGARVTLHVEGLLEQV